MTSNIAFSTPETLEPHMFTPMKVTELKFAIKYSQTLLRGGPRVSLSHPKDGLIRLLIEQLAAIYNSALQTEYGNMLGCISDYTRYAAICTHYKWRDGKLYAIPKNGPWTRQPGRPLSNPRETTLRAIETAIHSRSRSSLASASNSSSNSNRNSHAPGHAHARASSARTHNSITTHVSGSAFNDIQFAESEQVAPIKRLSEPLVFKSSNGRLLSSTSNFKLSIDAVDMINMTAKEPANGEYRVYWYMCSYADACSFTTKTPKRPVEAFYPPSITIALNSRSVSTANIGGRARAAPLDITDLVPMSSEISNSMVVNYNVSSMFVGMVMLAKRHTITSMIREIRARNTVPADLVRKTFFKETANNDDDDEDLVSTGALVSLRCPLGLVRITTPSRSKYCQHSQCFDCECFLQMKQRVPTIKCPVCSLDIKTWRELIVDCYFEDILNNTSSSDSHVYIEADGSWKPKEQMLAQDLDSRQKRKRSVDVNSQDAIDLSDFSCSEDNLARGNKRRRADVIDLTLDSDDDDYDDDDYDIDGNGNAGDHVYGGDGHQGADSIDSAETNSLSGNSDYSELPPLTQEDIEFIDTVEATAAGNIGNSGNAGNAENAQGQLAAAPALATTSMPEPSASNSQAPASLPRLSIGASTLQASVPPAAALTTTPLSPQQATTPWSTAVPANTQQAAPASGIPAAAAQNCTPRADCPQPTSCGCSAPSTPQSAMSKHTRPASGSRPRILDATTARSQGRYGSGNSHFSSPTSARSTSAFAILSSVIPPYPNFVRRAMARRASQLQQSPKRRVKASTMAAMHAPRNASAATVSPVSRVTSRVAPIVPNSVPKANGSSGFAAAQAPVVGMSPTYTSLFMNAEIAANNTPTATSRTRSHNQNGAHPST